MNVPHRVCRGVRMRIPQRFGNSNNRVPSGLLRSDRTKKMRPVRIRRLPQYLIYNLCRQLDPARPLVNPSARRCSRHAGSRAGPGPLALQVQRNTSMSTGAGAGGLFELQDGSDYTREGIGSACVVCSWVVQTVVDALPLTPMSPPLNDISPSETLTRCSVSQQVHPPSVLQEKVSIL